MPANSSCMVAKVPRAQLMSQPESAEPWSEVHRWSHKFVMQTGIHMLNDLCEWTLVTSHLSASKFAITAKTSSTKWVSFLHAGGRSGEKSKFSGLNIPYPPISSGNSCPHTFPFAGMQGSHSGKGMAILPPYMGYEELHVPGCKTHAGHNASFSSSFSYLAVQTGKRRYTASHIHCEPEKF